MVEASGRARGTVLLVDDDPLVHLLGGALLAGESYAVTGAASGDEALAMLEADPRAFDVLVTDVGMPGALDGLDLARIVDARWPWIRIVVTSSLAHVTDAHVPRRGRFLPKPWAAGALAAVTEAA